MEDIDINILLNDLLTWVLIAIPFLLYFFVVIFRESKGVLGFIANLIEYIYHKFWIIVTIIIIIIFLLYCLCYFLFSV